MDNVAWELGIFFQAFVKEVGLMKIATAHGFQNDFSYIYWKMKLEGIFGGFS